MNDENIKAVLGIVVFVENYPSLRLLEHYMSYNRNKEYYIRTLLQCPWCLFRLL